LSAVCILLLASVARQAPTRIWSTPHRRPDAAGCSAGVTSQHLSGSGRCPRHPDGAGDRDGLFAPSAPADPLSSEAGWILPFVSYNGPDLHTFPSSNCRLDRKNLAICRENATICPTGIWAPRPQLVIGTPSAALTAERPPLQGVSEDWPTDNAAVSEGRAAVPGAKSQVVPPGATPRRSQPRPRRLLTPACCSASTAAPLPRLRIQIYRSRLGVALWSVCMGRPVRALPSPTEAVRLQLASLSWGPTVSGQAVPNHANILRSHGGR